jgi:hypothetical protein
MAEHLAVNSTFRRMHRSSNVHRRLKVTHNIPVLLWIHWFIIFITEMFFLFLIFLRSLHVTVLYYADMII